MGGRGYDWACQDASSKQRSPPSFSVAHAIVASLEGGGGVNTIIGVPRRSSSTSETVGGVGAFVNGSTPPQPCREWEFEV